MTKKVVVTLIMILALAATACSNGQSSSITDNMPETHESEGSVRSVGTTPDTSTAPVATTTTTTQAAKALPAPRSSSKATSATTAAGTAAKTAKPGLKQPAAQETQKEGQLTIEVPTPPAPKGPKD